MTRYRYHGPVMGLTLATGGEVVAEEILVPGRSYTLPADHPRVAAMVAARRLTPSDGAVAPAEPPSPVAGDDAATEPTISPAADAAPRRRRTKEF